MKAKYTVNQRIRFNVLGGLVKGEAIIVKADYNEGDWYYQIALTGIHGTVGNIVDIQHDDGTFWLIEDEVQGTITG